MHQPNSIQSALGLIEIEQATGLIDIRLIKAPAELIEIELNWTTD